MERRRALVESALRAIRAKGSGVTVEEIAAHAQTSKTVIYRYFGDRAGLYLGVVDRVSENIMRRVGPALEQSHDLGAAIRALADGYSQLVERDPEIYQFVMHRPPSPLLSDADPIDSITDRIAVELAGALVANHTVDPDHHVALTLAHGVVGYIRSATGYWMLTPAGSRPPRSRLVDIVTNGVGVLASDPVPVSI